MNRMVASMRGYRCDGAENEKGRLLAGFGFSAARRVDLLSKPHFPPGGAASSEMLMGVQEAAKSTARPTDQMLTGRADSSQSAGTASRRGHAFSRVVVVACLCRRPQDSCRRRTQRQKRHGKSISVLLGCTGFPATSGHCGWFMCVARLPGCPLE